MIQDIVGALIVVIAAWFVFRLAFGKLEGLKLCQAHSC